MSAPVSIVDAFKALLFKQTDDLNREQRKKRKVPACPNCQAKCVVKCFPGFRCNQCAHQFVNCPKCQSLKIGNTGIAHQYQCGDCQHQWNTLVNPPQTRAKWLQDNPQEKQF